MTSSITTASAPIKEIKPGVYVGEMKLASGDTVYFGCEKLEKLSHSRSWNNYMKSAEKMAWIWAGFVSEINSESYPDFGDKRIELMGYNAEEYETVMQFVQRKKYFNSHVLDRLDDPISKSAQNCHPSDEKESRYIVYASSQPITKRLSSKSPGDQDTKIWGTGYKERFGHILMSYSLITKPSSRTTTHMGIFRNPIDFLDVEERYKGLSMKLHGFGAAVAKEHMDRKQYMVNSPQRKMMEIMVKCIGSEHVHIGTNKNLQEDKVNPMVKQYPPIVHIDGKGIVKIAKRDIDLRNYLDHLPDEKAEIIGPQLEDINHHSATGLMAVVDITPLANLFLDKVV